MAKRNEAAEAAGGGTETEATRSLAGALHQAQRAVATQGRDAHNQHHGYRYVSAEKMVEAGREALGSAGLSLHRLDARLQSDCVPPMLHCEFRIMHWPSGQTLESGLWSWPVIESKGRPLDKAYAGALTTSLAYYLRDLLLIPKGDENEVDRRDDRDHDPDAMGVPMAVKARARLTAVGASLDALRLHIARLNGGEEPPEDMARWPKAWLGDIKAWVESLPVPELGSAEAD